MAEGFDFDGKVVLVTGAARVSARRSREHSQRRAPA
jgi:hypothetical protein